MTSPSPTFSTGEPNLCVCLSVRPTVWFGCQKKIREENSEKNWFSVVYYGKSILTEMFFKINALDLEVFLTASTNPFTKPLFKIGCKSWNLDMKILFSHHFQNHTLLDLPKAHWSALTKKWLSTNHAFDPYTVIY